MNTGLTAGAAVDAVETIVWRYDNGEEITRSMLKDAGQGITALRELIAADEEYDAAWIELSAQENADDDDELYMRALTRHQWACDRRASALAACRKVGAP
jgi:hypothetical protein